MPEPVELLDQALAKLRSANRIDGNRNSYRKDSPNEYAAVMSYLAGGSRPPAVVSDMGVGLMLAEDARRGLVVVEPEPEPTPVYPASYYTGPLGKAGFMSKMLPSDPNKTFLCECYGGIGVDWTAAKAGLQARENAIGRVYDGIQVNFGSGTYAGSSNCIAGELISQNIPQWIHDHGSRPLIFWSPNHSLASVNAGNADACLQSVADYLGSFGFPMMVRLFHEFNIPGLYPWNGTGAAFTSAWQRAVSIFNQRGADNVGFWWCPEELTNHAGVNASYPGDEYVDWVGSDNYNMQLVGGAGYNTPYHPGWATFSEIFDYGSSGNAPIHDTFGPRKAFVIGETATIYDSAAPQKKGEWYRAVPAAIAKMEHLAGVAVFDVDAHESMGSYRVDHPTSNPDCMAGYVQMTTGAIWN